MIRRRDRPRPVAVHDDLQRVADIVEIVERLAHPHHHDVGQHPALRLARPFAERIARQHHLADDLAGVEVADQPHRAGEAEAAVERAADLAGDAERAAVRVGDEDHLIIMAVGRLEQPFAGAVGRDLLHHHLRAADREALGEPGALRLGDVAHRVEAGGAAIVDLVPELLGAQLRLPLVEPRLGERGANLRLGEADQLDARVVAPLERGAARGPGRSDRGSALGLS